jgi:RNA polymerase sigma-70 factor, ECF subfamily
MPSALTSDAIARVFREEYGRVVAGLVRLLGSIDLAEESVQEAFVVATERWPETGLPPNPGAWITVTARNRALDRIRRESTRGQREQRATMTDDQPDAFEDDIGDDMFDEAAISDDRLRLIFTCCHPALAPDAQVALTLRLLGGLHASEIARGFLVPEATMRQRITRAKRKIAANNIPYRVPEATELPERLAAVLAVIYLVFNEGYVATAGADLVRDDLCLEAIRLARILADLMPDEPEAIGLLALMLLTAARRRARSSANGELVQLRDQDRRRWDASLIREGHELVRACVRRNHPGPYQIQAAINAVHTDAPVATDTDWHQVVQLYDQLMQIAPSPVVAMNRAIALAELDGPDVGLAALDGLPLDQYQPYHSTRADLLRRAGRAADSVDAYEQALALTTNDAERRFLERRLAEIT